MPSSLRSSFEQKENERDLNCSKTARARSPVMPCSKVVKSFMAPTISTSSKAIAASPRRKILAERNEVVRSSLTSVCDSHESLAMAEVVSKPQLGCGPHTLRDALNLPEVSSDELGSKDIVPKSEMGFGFQEVLDGAGSRNVDQEVKNLQPVIVSSSPSPAIAPLDSSPSVPPYDPKTNYLSPRPQFLRYRPNPRIEHYLNKEGALLDMGDGKQLEDSFSIESCEATSSQTEEVQPSDSQKDSEEVSSSNEVEAMEATETLVSEPVFIPYSNSKHIKSCSFGKFKFIPLLLVLVIPFLFVPLSDSPILYPPSSMLKAPALLFYEDLPFRNHLTASSVNFKELTRSLGQWSVNLFSYYTNVASLPKEEEFSLLCLANLTTALVMDEGLENYEQLIGKTEMEQAFKKHMGEESSEGHEIERKFEVEDSGAVQDNDAEYETVRMEMEQSEDLREYIMEFDQEKIETELQEDVKQDNDVVEFETVNNVEEDSPKDMEQEGNIQGIEDQKNIEVEIYHSHDFVTETEIIDSEEDGSDFSFLSQTKPGDFDSHPVVGNKYQTSSSPNSEESTIYGSKYELSVPSLLGVLLAAAVLAASLVFLRMKQKQTARVVSLEKLPPHKLISTSISGSSESYINKRRSYYQNSPVDVEMMGDSGPSELSTGLCNSSSFGQGRTKRAKEEENFSYERKLRRDSAVSSSSISYGSFTTYEKVSAKKVRDFYFHLVLWLRYVCLFTLLQKKKA